MFLDREIQSMQTDRIVGMGLIQVPEKDKIFAPLTVLENLELGAYLRRLDRNALKMEIEKVCTLFPILRDRGDRAAGTLSGGERQMLALGRALMGKPRLLMLDEPSLGLAPAIVSEMFRIIQSLNSMGTTILLVEQNAREALRISNRA